MRPFECTLVQFDAPLAESSDETVSRMVTVIEEANTDLVVFPELTTTGYNIFDRLDELAEPIPGPTTEKLGSAAEATGTAVLFGMPVVESGSFYNTAVWIDPDGTVRGRYDKRHLWADERDAFEPGDSYLIVEAPFGRIGVQICYDLVFPEMSAALAAAECDVLVNISAWTVRMERDWWTLLPARAVEQGAYVLGCNRSGVEAGDSFCGRSMVVEPDGTVIQEMAGGPGRVSTRLDPGIAEAERTRNPFREDRLETTADVEVL
jgi:(R)-amidase